MHDSDSETYEDPAAVVRRFIADMHRWELQTLSAHEGGNWTTMEQAKAFWGAAQRGLDEVFARWCTPKERKHGRLGSFSNPPEYQPDHEAILEVVTESSRRSSVHTQQGTGFRHKRKYVLLKKDDRWLIDSVKWQKNDGSWSNGVL